MFPVTPSPAAVFITNPWPEQSNANAYVWPPITYIVGLIAALPPKSFPVTAIVSTAKYVFHIT